MKKIIFVTVIAISVSSPVLAFDYFQPPNASNMNFYPMMQHQIEKQETLDFINNPNEYKNKREAKDRQLDYQEDKINDNSYFKPVSQELNSDEPKPLPQQPGMEFTKDENGNIRIQGLN